jgi:hypothetical protein
LNKVTLKPFLIRLWGQEEQPEVKNGLLHPKEQGNPEKKFWNLLQGKNSLVYL